MKKTLLAVCMLYLAGSAAVAADLEALQQACDAARESRLAPERDELIEECAAKNRNTRDYCERFYRDHGAGGSTGPGTYRQRKYHDIPECQALYDAEAAARER